MIRVSPTSEDRLQKGSDLTTNERPHPPKAVDADSTLLVPPLLGQPIQP